MIEIISSIPISINTYMKRIITSLSETNHQIKEDFTISAMLIKIISILKTFFLLLIFLFCFENSFASEQIRNIIIETKEVFDKGDKD